MNKIHSFFLSEEQYCTDIRGILQHLGEKINQVYLCILCENKGCKLFTTGEAVKKHMISKGHCFMQSEIFDEYADFYDFTPQIEAAVEYQKTLKYRPGHEKIIEIVQNRRAGEEGEEWESDLEGVESSDDEEEVTVPSTKKQQASNEIPVKKPKTKSQQVNNDGEWEEVESSDEEAEPEIKPSKRVTMRRAKVALEGDEKNQTKKYKIHRLK